jgi:hypothetical protein
VTLTFELLAARVGEAFSFATSADPVSLALAEAEPNGHGGGSLLFTGPASPRLTQGTYEVTHPGASGPLFVVPVAAGETGTTYQAVFG